MTESDSEEYVVERILAAKGSGKARRFLIKWEGYDDDGDNTWEPAKHLPKQMIATFDSASKDESNAEESDDSDGSDGEYVPSKKGRASKPAASAKPKTPAPETSKSKGKAPASERRVTPTTAGTKRPAAAIGEAEEPPSAESICAALGTMDATSLKAFATALSKEGFEYKAAAKKDETLADLGVVVRATYDGLCLVHATSSKHHVLVGPGQFQTVTTWSYARSGLKSSDLHGSDAAPPKFGTERVRSCSPEELGWMWNERFNRLPTAERIRRLEEAWARSSASHEAKRVRASLGVEGKVLASSLSVLEKGQLVDLVIGLVADGAVSSDAVSAKMPGADLQPVLDECQRLVNAIRRHLPNSRWGSCTDNYGYKRCAAANNAAARAFKTHAADLKKAAQWGVAAAFADKALPIARGMVEWDSEANNGARNSAIDALTKLKQEADAKAAVLVD
jgi:hypothetical protein